MSPITSIIESVHFDIFIVNIFKCERKVYYITDSEISANIAPYRMDELLDFRWISEYAKRECFVFYGSN